MQNDSLLTADLTDAKGAFYFDLLPANYTLLALHFGTPVFKKNVLLDQPLHLGTLPIDQNIELEEVVINAEKKIIERKEDKIIYNVENTLLHKGNNGLEVLQNAPIVWVDNDGQILIRQETATVYIDGSKINLVGINLSNYIKSLDAENIKTIEIQTNASANIDGDVTGGIINIILNKKPLGHSINTRVYRTHYNKEYADTYGGVSLNYGSKKWNTYALYSYKENIGGGNFDSEFSIKKNQQTQKTLGTFENTKDNHI